MSSMRAFKPFRGPKILSTDNDYLVESLEISQSLKYLPSYICLSFSLGLFRSLAKILFRFEQSVAPIYEVVAVSESPGWDCLAFDT